MKKMPADKAIASHNIYEKEIAPHIEAINRVCEARGWEHVAVTSLGTCETRASYCSSNDSLMSPATLSNMLTGLQTYQLGHVGLGNTVLGRDQTGEILGDSFACADHPLSDQ